jgi:tryptophan synthase alpha chain
MTHLVANYPDPEKFQAALTALLKLPVEYVEVQLPFSHPVADGPTIYEANQQALAHSTPLSEIIPQINSLRDQLQSPTRLLLMSYLTPLLHYGLENLIQLLSEQNFTGLIVPDLTAGSQEYHQLSRLCHTYQIQFLPVISPLTSRLRLRKIKPFLQPGQLIYATARVGQTGGQTDFQNLEIQEYLDFLKTHLANYQLAVGFGIREGSQVQFLNQQNFTAIIGSQIVREINAAVANEESVNKRLTHFLQNLY